MEYARHDTVAGHARNALALCLLADRSDSATAGAITAIAKRLEAIILLAEAPAEPKQPVNRPLGATPE